jgi:hypothetical protein
VDPCRQAGLEPAALAAGDPLGVEPERSLQLVQPPDLLRVVAVDGRDQRAALPVREVDPGALG